MSGDTAKRVLFRVDASANVGTGHLVRCLALAATLRQRGFLCTFAMADPEVRYADAVRSARHRLTAEGATQPTDLHDWVVLDHYGLGETWLTGPATAGAQRLVIDDLEDRPLPCEVLLNANPYATREAYRSLCPPETRLLLGTRFALLRSPFGHTGRGRSFGVVRNVLISLGGGSSRGLDRLAVRAVRRCLPSAAINVVLGHDDPLDDAAQDERVTTHRSVDAVQMARLLDQADLGIGAGGMSIWERCSAGLPSISLRLASNQDRVVDTLTEAGVTLDGGRVNMDTEGRIERQVADIAGDQEGRRTMSVRARAMVDGLGTTRVANLVDGVRLRRATRKDARRLFSWVNDPITRANSFSQQTIGWDRHVDWLTNRLSDRDTLLFVGSNSEGAVGQVRFDLGDVPEVSISVAPEHRGVMIGGLLLGAALIQLAAERGPSRVFARVRESNLASRRMFEETGFALERQHGDELWYVRAPAPS